MNDSLSLMLQKYKPVSTEQAIQALREIIQEIALLGLWRAKFFDHAAFYGGTALRIFHGLNRFSEDLDFSLLKPDSEFSLDTYNKAIKKELESFGFTVAVETKLKNIVTDVESAFIKADTRHELITIGFEHYAISGIPRDAKIKVKLEVDTNPPPLFETELKILSNPFPVSVRCYTPSSLFAGKIHALLCRLWKNRVKGRDWYDLVWFVSNKTPLDLRHLESRMHQNGFLEKNQHLDLASFKKILQDKILHLDIEKAKADISPFITDVEILNAWNKDYFLAITNQIIP